MTAQDRLDAWMKEKGYSNSSLARELNFGYDHIYSVVNGIRPMNEKFQFRFQKRFGIKEANRIFEPSPQEVA